MSNPIETDVVIVGAGPVGCGLAIELGWNGVRCLVVERRGGAGSEPRSNLANARTMGLFRRWGIAGRLREAAPLPPGHPSDISFVTRLTGWELTRFPDSSATADRPDGPFPEPGLRIPQRVTEEVLRKRAEELSHVTFLRGFCFVDFREADDHVQIDARDLSTDRSVDVRARYLVGCDGSRSDVRERMGVSMVGRKLADDVSAVFRAPALASLNDKKAALHYSTVTPSAASVLGVIDATDWWYHRNEAPAGGRISDSDLRQSFYAAVGAVFPCEVVDSSPCVAERRIADSYGAVRVFLLGDAAHVHPPMGGFGMNLGIADAVDFGWKLAAVLKGWGRPSLLRTFEAERRPIHERIIEEASTNYARNSRRFSHYSLEKIGADGQAVRARVARALEAEKPREWSSPEVRDHVPTARPGHLLPHAQLDDRRCLHDLLGPGLTLLQFGGKADLRAPIADAATTLRLPLKVVELRRSDLRELCEANLVLVRPDQHVAWRGMSAGDPRGILGLVTGIGLRTLEGSSPQVHDHQMHVHHR